MVEKFFTIDVVSGKFQTHSTLSACRGLLRFYESTKDPALLEKVQRIYGAYISLAITENYENYNWFGRPEWTEPCAVIDSFIVAMGLWKHTANTDYLEDAHHILFNGMGYEERPTGGWGCDVCAGAGDEFLSPAEGVYEAWWCCLMRGGEGLSRAVEYPYFFDNDQIVLGFYNSSLVTIPFSDGEIRLQQTSDYPADGNVKLSVLHSSVTGTKTFRLFIPGWAPKESVRLKHNGNIVPVRIEEGFAILSTTVNTGDTVELCFDPGIRSADTVCKNSIQGYHTFRHGPLVLGVMNDGEPISIARNAKLIEMGEASYRVDGTNVVLSPIREYVYTPLDKALGDRRQILFKD